MTSKYLLPEFSIAPKTYTVPFRDLHPAFFACTPKFKIAIVSLTEFTNHIKFYHIENGDLIEEQDDFLLTGAL